MTTARDVVRGALVMLGVIDPAAQPSAVDAEDALTALNDMALAWDSQNIHTGWQALLINDDVILEPQHIEGLKAMLAERIAPSHGVGTLPTEVKMRAMEGKSQLFADYGAPETLRCDNGLTHMPSGRRFFGAINE